MQPARATARASRYDATVPLPTRMVSAALLIAAALTIQGRQARAEEAYVCEDGRVVQVRIGELDRLKRTDPCIAAYHKMKVEPAGAPPATPLAARGIKTRGTGSAIVPAAPSTQVQTASVNKPLAPPPAHNPEFESAAEVAVEAPLARVAARAEIITSPRVEKIVFRHQAPARAGTIGPVSIVPAGAVDYRHVPIINAAPGSDAIYVHTR
ncbi:MAG: hypothetical protein JNM89_06860 [Hyphomicrobiaceae bacterium]|nr:hypothetical protein [Hyphomicrobiaceae bacterium]